MNNRSDSIILKLTESHNVRRKWLGNRRIYTATTDDPQLVYILSENAQDNQGTMLLTVAFRSDSYIQGQTKVYIDRGRGFSEQAGWWEPAMLLPTGELIAFIYDPAGIKRLRIDPIATDGNFEIDRPLLTSVKNLDDATINAYLGFAAAITSQAANLFDVNYYRDFYGLTNDDREAANCFAELGHAFEHNPNFAFHSESYERRNSIVLESETPIHHYIRIGEAIGCSPSEFFDLSWYRREHLGSSSVPALAHFLMNRRTLRIGCLPEIDPVYYLQAYPDVEEAGRDASEHFLTHGFREDRQPSAWFQTGWYRAVYLNGAKEINPLIHYRSVGQRQGYLPSAASRSSAVHDAILANVGRSSLFEEIFRQEPLQNLGGIELLAFYLPQFHSFAENDQWWGKGFTEWTNVARGAPRYVGHYQPRIPRDLGCYNLRDVENTIRQEKLARAHGISGFIYYYYWFDGHRLLHIPLENKLACREATLPFALMWANENWTRRWDGGDHEILIAQNYKKEDDERLIADFARHMTDKRYILIDGRPVLFIYRPGIIPNAETMFINWRKLFNEKHGLNPLIVMAQFGADLDPRSFGLDGALEFPPHKVASGATDYRPQTDIIDPGFIGTIHKYEDIIERSLQEEAPDYPLIKSVFPSWDNDARRQRRSTSFAGSTPALYERWLRGAIQHARQRQFFGHTIVGINAWNEWAEGCYLEPDVHYGAAYLNATARAVIASNVTSKPTPLIVGHDAHHHGAQRLLLYIVREMVQSFGVKPKVVLLGGGSLVPDYMVLAPTRVLEDATSFAKYLDAESSSLRTALLNTTPGARHVKMLAQAGLRTVSLIHELPTLISRYGLQNVAADVAKFSSSVVFPASYVKSAFENSISADISQAIILPQGLFDKIDLGTLDTKRELYSQLGLSEEKKVVVNAGYGDLRKGFDIFLQVARAFEKIDSSVHFVWIGAVEAELGGWLIREASTGAPRTNLSLVGFRDDLSAVLSVCDVFLLTSREDPFPSVVLDALACGLPIVAMADTGGFTDLFENDFVGELAPYEDVRGICDSISKFLSVPSVEVERLSQQRRDYISNNFNFKKYCFSLLQMLGLADMDISVFVPNYNYEKYIKERVDSICDQNYPIFEFHFLDDASTDGSVQRAIRAREETGRSFDIVENATNSGNVFKQWGNGIERCSGELIWIAEADDSCKPDFLREIVEKFKDNPQMLFAFSDSVAIDQSGSHLMASYKDYQASMGSPEFASDFVVDSFTFAAKHLSVVNTVLNVSSVVWRKSALLAALKRLGSELFDYRLAGDWRLYLEVCALGGDVGYVAKSLNVHRRHSGSVTGALPLMRQAQEVEKVQAVAEDYFGEHINDERRALMKQYVLDLNQRAEAESN